MQNYKPCLFRKTVGNSTVRDSREWGVYIKSIALIRAWEVEKANVKYRAEQAKIEAYKAWYNENKDKIDKYITASFNENAHLYDGNRRIS